MRKHAASTFVLVFLTTALIGVVGPPGTAAAQEPATPSTARYEELSRSAARASEDVLTARQVLDDKRVALDEATGSANRSRLLADEAAGALARATDAADQAQAVEAGLRAEIDHIVEISFKGLRLNGLAAIFSSDSPEEFLDAAMIMDVYAERHGDLVTAAAEAAREAELRQEQLDGEVAEVRRALDQLAVADRAVLTGTGPAVDVPAVEGAGGDAVRFALAQLGKPYVWGAVGPDTYDCSGLVMTAFRSAGVQVPRTTYVQALAGTAVRRDQVRPGDLVLYYDSLSHVAMAIDGTMAVHASTAGEPVKVSPINAIGPIATIRRIGG